MPPPWPVTLLALSPVSCGAVLWRMGGVQRLTIVTKATFGLVHEGPARLVQPLELTVEDRARDPVTGALEEGSDLAPYLPSAGVVLDGHAHAPGGQPAPAMAVRLSIYRDQRALLDKTLHVFGYQPPVPNAAPQPFQKIPLRWDRAYGGPGVEDNPAGSGAAGSRALPNVLDPAEPTRPAGFGPVARGWGQRRRMLGSADPASLSRAVPEVPEGFDFRWFHAAPTDQQIEMLRGDEWIVVEGMHPSLPRISTRLPSARAEARVLAPGAAPRPVEMVADTLILDVDRQQCALLFRGHFMIDAAMGEALAQMQVHAGLEMPGHPLTWPTAMAKEAAASRPVQRAAPVEPGGAPDADAPLPRFHDDDDPALSGAASLPLKGAALPTLPSRQTEAPPPPQEAGARTADAVLPFRPIPASPPVAPPPIALPPPPIVGAAPPVAPPPVAPPGAPPAAPERAGDALRAKVTTALAAGAGLRDLDLRGADLRGLDFRRASLGSLDLRNANLRGCNLAGTRLGDAVLEGAVLEGADLTGADLTRANLARADLSRAILTGARFDEAILDEATLLGASCAGASFVKARAGNANLERLDGDGVDLSGAMLEGANLRQARLPDAVLTGADLRGVTANRVDLSRAKLTRADLGNAVLRAGKLPGAVLAHANLEGADLRDADLERANLFAAQRKTAKLNGASVKDVVEVDPGAS